MQVTQDESHFKDASLSAKYWSKIGMRILLPWSGGHHRFSMLCSMVMDDRVFFNQTKKVDTTSFLEHIEKVYSEVGKMVLFVDKASWHMSKDAVEFFQKREIILVWYPVRYPYLNPVEEVWNVLKQSMDHSIRYADLETHLDVVHKFVKHHTFDYDFRKYWRRKPPKGIMQPITRLKGKSEPEVEEA